MSTNKSQNLNLHLWEPEDNFLRTEFNENFAAIDTAVKDDRAAIANAQNTANTALAALPYVMGSYVGTGEDREFNLGFRPSFVIIFRTQCYSDRGHAGDSTAIASARIDSQRIFLTDQGFRFDMSSGAPYPVVNVAKTQYDYIAFR